MIIVSSSELRLDLRDLSPGVLASIQNELSFPNPEYLAAQKAGRWTGRLDELIHATEIEEQALYLPRGCQGWLVGYLQARGLAVEVVDYSGLGSPLIVGDLRQPLRDYQAEAVDALCAARQGLGVAPCGAGKTQIGVATIQRLGRSALVLVHTQDLVDQWRERIRTVLGLEAGVVGGGKRDVQPVTVATVQTLDRWSAAEVERFGAGFGVVIVDEAHHGPARTYRRLLALLSCRYRYGLTATPERDDGLTPLLGWTFGPILHTVERGRLIDCGALVAPRRVALRTGFRWDGDPVADYSGLVSALVDDPDRNAQIVDLAGQLVRSGETVLVLSSRVEHCERLATLLQEAGTAAVAVTGTLCAKRRKAALAQARTGGIRCLIATQLADEGLDVPRLSALILAAPSRAAGRTIQRIGRIMRPAPGKEDPVVYDLVDAEIGLLQSQAWSRARAFRRAVGQ
ncbi:MAG: DEAD/DEAH box helicase [Myxococcota bacterium]|jgi:superfamily II DNA or RNA helicase|nr:DEAD/DEAH box helicase [Myxococcota bacterium]